MEHNKALGLLGIANKGGNVAIGEEPVGSAAHGGTARLIVLASDAADHSVRRARSYAALHNTPMIQLDVNKDGLGAVFGRTSVAMLAITEINLAERFLGLLPEQTRYAEAAAAVQEKAAIMKKRKAEKQKRNGPNRKK